MKSFQNLIPKIQHKTNSSSCILFAILFASLLVSPFGAWSSVLQSHASKILRKDSKIAAVAIAYASDLVSERDFKTLSFPIQHLTIFHWPVEAEEKV